MKRRYVPSDRAKEILLGMTTEEKVGQLFLCRCPADDDQLEVIRKYHLGGYTLYGVDFESRSPEKVKENIASYQKESKIPMLIAIDEEGGRVVRASLYPEFRDEPFPYARTLYLRGGIPEILRDAREKSQFLLSYGINFNLAPVCDMTENPENFIYHRTLGEDVDTTCAYIKGVTEVMQEEHIGLSLKHFPGYGDNVDTHTSVGIDHRTKEEFYGKDLKPFLAGIDAGANVVMLAHNILTEIDPDFPASLSSKVVQMLREEIGYDGIIMTDSLDMAAITKFTGDEVAAVTAVRAGVDLLCCSTYNRQVPAVLRAVESGELSLSRIEASALRIIDYKLELGLLK